MKIILIGDSIRMGYQSRVMAQLRGRADVWAPKENCGHTLRIRENLQSWVIDQRPDVVHFNSGIHDLGWMDGERVARFTAGEYVRSLRIIIERMRQGTQAKLIFATTTPILAPCDPSLPNDRCKVPPIVARYNTAAVALMQSLKVPVNDLYREIIRAGVNDCIGPDKIHMTDLGNETLAAAVMKAVSKA